MKARFVLCVLFALALAQLAAPSPARAQTVRDATPLEFHDQAEERRFHALVSELRCVMCQNQSLADSNAQIAHDLRREVFDLMRAGRSDAEIREFLVARYGEFVLYRPRFGGHTWLLWLAPALLLFAGGAVIVRILRARGREPVAADDEQEW
ncbi:MAG: cytochrome c-type biogenesis protein CcmH [Luteimonas sp.]|nr:cytochrome c-type biogenesis protein CcmH [Luteimonas sp.]